MVPTQIFTKNGWNYFRALVGSSCCWKPRWQRIKNYKKALPWLLEAKNVTWYLYPPSSLKSVKYSSESVQNRSSMLDRFHDWKGPLALRHPQSGCPTVHHWGYLMHHWFSMFEFIRTSQIHNVWKRTWFGGGGKVYVMSLSTFLAFLATFK